MRKNVMKSIILVAIILIIMASPITVMADTNEAMAIGTAAASAAYDASVVSRMAGRAGSATSTGAKGISFEVMYMDKLNCQNFFKDVSTRFTKSSTATQSDLVTVNSNGNIVKRIQCKNVTSKSGINNTIEKLPQYKGADLVGTTESAEAYNSVAVEKGVKQMVDSKISTEATERIANKALGKMPSASKLAGTAGKAAGVGAAVSGGIAATESIINGDSFPDGVANVAVEAGKGAVSTGVGAASAEAVAAGISAAGVSGAAAVAAPVVAVVVIGGVTYYVLDKTDEGLEVKQNVSKATDKAMTVAADTYVKTEDYVATNAPIFEQNIYDGALEMANTTDNAIASAADTYVKTEDYIAKNAPAAKEAATDTALAMANTTDEVLSDAGEFWLDAFNKGKVMLVRADD